MGRPESRQLARSLQAAGFRGELRSEEPLAPYTTWRIGGPGQLLAQPVDSADVICAIRWAAQQRVPWRVLGNGSNLLVRDRGVRGLVLRIRKVLDHVQLDQTRIRAGAGTSLPALANLAAAHGLEGLEFAAGIPGTLGGALVMNAGWHEFEMRQVVSGVEAVATDGVVCTLTAQQCRFGYRHSIFRERTFVILAGELHLQRGDPQKVQRRLAEFAASRRHNQPTDQPSCGSVFLKPEGDFAGRLIEASGLKGLRIGDAEVSPKHANFFINVGRASSDDVLRLVERVEREVESRFGIRLVREFELW